MAVGNESSRTPRSNPTIGFNTLLNGIRRYSVTTFVFFLMAIAIGIMVYAFLPLPKMTAYSVFKIDSAPNAVFMNSTWDQRVEFSQYKNLQANRIRARAILSDALDKEGVLTSQILRKQPRGQEANWLYNNLKVDTNSMGQEFMKVSLEGDDETDLLNIIKGVTEAYMKAAEGYDKLNRTKHFEELMMWKTKYDKMLEDSRESMNKLIRQLGSNDPITLVEKEKNEESMAAMYQREILAADQEIRKASVELRYLDIILKNNGGREPNPADVNQLIQMDPELQDLSKKKIGLQNEIQATKLRLTKNAPLPPTLVAAEQQLVILDKQLEDIPNKLRPLITNRLKEMSSAPDRSQHNALERKVKLLTDQKAQVETLLKQLMDDKTKNNIARIELEKIKTNIAQTQKMADHVQTDIEKMRPEMENPARVMIWEQPIVIPGIEGNRRFKYAAISSVVLLAMGLGFVTWMEFHSRRIVAISELSNNLGLRVVGTVPKIPRGAAAMAEEDHWQQVLTEAVDSTRAVLLPVGSGKPTTRTLLIASATSGEGKTSLACRLAVCMAKAGFRTLLIDADMRRPAVHRMFDLPLGPGLADVLAGQAHYGATVQLQAGGLVGLDILTAGIWTPEGAAGLSGRNWETLRGLAEAGHDMVLIDSPPLLPVADGLLLAKRVDGVVLSVMRDVSRFDAVETAKNKLALIGANILGVVFAGVTGVRNNYYDRRYAKPFMQTSGSTIIAGKMDAGDDAIILSHVPKA